MFAQNSFPAIDTLFIYYNHPYINNLTRKSFENVYVIAA